MPLKVKELSKEIMDAIMSSDKISLVDSGDQEPTEVSKNTYSFGMDKIQYYHSDRLAHGKYEYTVTVTGKYIPFDE
jgi:hypothetical protein